jgi:hypothetical protein
MAEVIGAVASGITIAGLAITIADTITNIVSQVINAPEELRFLHNDVVDTRLILWNIKENASQDQSIRNTLSLRDCPETYGNPEDIAKTEFLIRRIERVMTQIHLTLGEVTKSKSLDRVTIHQGSWLLNRIKIRSLRTELQELKTNLTIHLSASTG